jgi:gluconolactonase
MKILQHLALLLVSFAAWPLLAAEPATMPASLPPLATAAEARAIGFGPTIAADATVTKLGGGYGFTEGATTAANGDVFFVDQDNNRIHHWSAADNKITIFLEPSGRANGQYFDRKGNLVSCADEKNELWSIAPNGKHTVLISSAGYQGKPLDGPNDVWIRPDGGLYVTDPFYSRKWWDPSVARPAQSVRAVYYLAPGGKELKRVAEGFQMPNGIVGTPDGKTLYVADIDGNKIYAYDIQPDGSLPNRRLICNYGSDGMTLDNQGNIYLSANMRGITGVSIIEIKTGKLVGFVTVPQQPANMAFGGKNHDQLFLTARTGFYMIQTKVKGANPAK